MLSNNISDCLSPLFLLESFQFRNHIVHTAKGPHVILICDNSIESNKIKDG